MRFCVGSLSRTLRGLADTRASLAVLGLTFTLPSKRGSGAWARLDVKYCCVRLGGACAVILGWIRNSPED